MSKQIENQDEIRLDFIGYMPSDVCAIIMSFLDDPADIIRANKVSRSWRKFVVVNGLARQLCLISFPQLSRIHFMNTGDGPTIWAGVSTEWTDLVREQKIYASLLHALTKSEVNPKDCIKYALCASSTDNYPSESCTHTLNPRNRFINRPSYWSSKGHRDPSVPETLIYELWYGLWLITEIDIQPFEAFFQPGSPIYSSSSVRFRFGHLKHPNALGSVSPGFQHADDKFVWTYVSPEFPMAKENRLQPFKLPKPILSIGGFLQIELMGRVQTQEVDGLYYICVCYVRVLGRPLYPAFDIDLMGRDEVILLEYHPENLGSVVKNSPSLQVPRLGDLDHEMLWERISLLENLSRRIRMLNPNQFAPDEDMMDNDQVV